MSNKYEPKNLSDFVIADKEAAITLDLILSGQMPFPAAGKNGLLIYGPPGVGKTELAWFIAKNLIQSKVLLILKREDKEAARKDLLRSITLDCADMHANTFSTPQTLPDFEHYIESVFNCVRMSDYAFEYIDKKYNHAFVILNNAHHLSDIRAEQLVAIMDRFSKSIYVFTQHNTQSINPSLKSRCHLIGMPAAPARDWVPLARNVLMDNGQLITDYDEIVTIIAGCKGDARCIINTCIREACIRNNKNNAGNEAA